MKHLNGIEAVVYDWDGTAIDTEKLHAEGWKYAGEKFGAVITEQMLIDQKGRSGLDAAKIMLGEDTPRSILDEFRQTKKSYVEEQIGNVELFPGFMETHDYLVEKGKLVWICTSAPIELIKPVIEAHPELRVFEGKMVLKGMYSEPKPSGEPILKTLEMMSGIKPQNAIYIGDAHSDYQSAVNANTGFVYYCPNAGSSDARIPQDVPHIKNHEELKELTR